MRFLIVKTSSLGDIVQAFSVLGYLRRRFPEAIIDWVVESPFAELPEAHPFIRRVWRIDTKKWRKALWKPQCWQDISAFARALRQTAYDVVFDLQGNLKSGCVVALARGQAKVGYGWKSVAEKPNLLFTHKKWNCPPGKNIREDYLSLVQAYFKDDLFYREEQTLLQITQNQEEAINRLWQGGRLEGKKKILVCPGSAWPNKRLTPETLFFLLQKIAQRGDCFFFLLWGDEKEKSVSQEICQKIPTLTRLLDRLPLPALQRVMAQMDLTIAMDSLPLHLAALAGTPTFSVFGASFSHKYRPLGEKHVSYQGVCPFGVRFEKRCPRLRSCETGSCIRDLTAKELFTVLNNQLNRLDKETL